MTQGRLTTTEAAALLAWHLAHGEAIGNAEASELTGLSQEGARQMLCRLCRVLPILFHNGRWMAVALLETET